MDMTRHLLFRLNQVRQNLGMEPVPHDDTRAPLADVLDSMAMVEYLALLGEDFGVEPSAIEEAAGHRFGSIADLAAALAVKGIQLRSLPSLSDPPQAHSSSAADVSSVPGPRAAPAPTPVLHCDSWLVATATRLPKAVQSAAEINRALHRPDGWLEQHAGIRGRHLWRDEDPLAAAAAAGQDCLRQAELNASQVGALLVTSEAPPRLAGVAAAMHQRLGLRAGALALDVGGACTGYLAALRMAQALLPQAGAVLVVAAEAPSHYLRLQPGENGEAAALFGDGVARVCYVRLLRDRSRRY
jgi:hypothetical protein